jgi:hypothetical protein
MRRLRTNLQIRDVEMTIATVAMLGNEVRQLLLA